MLVFTNSSLEFYGKWMKNKAKPEYNIFPIQKYETGKYKILSSPLYFWTGKMYIL